MNEDSVHQESFLWQDCAARLGALIAQRHMVASPNGNYFVSSDDVGGRPALEFHAPPCFPLTSETQDPLKYVAQLDDVLGDQLMVLIQAGAAALGWWCGEDVIHHKVIKTYVVRGRGRSQTLYAKTKGKSRYGSRLRLRNAQQHLVDINEKVHEWWGASGPADRIFYSCPLRSWPELFSVSPAPPFGQRDERLVKIPLHVHVPNFEELLRVRSQLLRGRILQRSLG